MIIGWLPKQLDALLNLLPFPFRLGVDDQPLVEPIITRLVNRSKQEITLPYILREEIVLIP
jgi:hypothetical protein